MCAVVLVYVLGAVGPAAIAGAAAPARAGAGGGPVRSPSVLIASGAPRTAVPTGTLWRAVLIDADVTALPLRFQQPTPPALIGPRPARPPQAIPPGAPPAVARTRAGTSGSLDLTLLVWASFFAAAVIAGTAGLVHRIRTRPSGTNVFGRPTHEVDQWLASAEMAATTAPAPVDQPADAPRPDGNDRSSTTPGDGAQD